MTASAAGRAAHTVRPVRPVHKLDFPAGARRIIGREPVAVLAGPPPALRLELARDIDQPALPCVFRQHVHQPRLEGDDAVPFGAVEPLAGVAVDVALVGRHAEIGVAPPGAKWFPVTSVPLGTGIAAGLEKGSYIAICAEVRVECESIEVERLVSAFECGAVLNRAACRPRSKAASFRVWARRWVRRPALLTGSCSTARSRNTPCRVSEVYRPWRRFCSIGPTSNP